MNKYWAFCRVSIQNTLMYRGPIVVWLLVNLLSLITIIAVWSSASAVGLIGGYTKPELVTYYVAALFLEYLTGWFPYDWLKDEIKNGQIVLTILNKPISLFKQVFAEELGWHMVTFWIGLLTCLILVILMPQNIVLSLSFSKIFLLAPAIGLAILITLTTSLCMGLLAFWFTEISAIGSIFWITRLFLGGQGVPMSFLPSGLQTLAKILPFRYMFSFPLEIFFGKLSLSETSVGFGIAIVWVIILFVIYRLMFARGRRAYTAFGN